MTTVHNTQLLQETIAAVLAQPEKHKQSEWRCETGMCFAGHAAMLAGAEWAHPEDLTNPYIKTTGTLDVHVSNYAAEALGLDGLEEAVLFEGDNTTEDLVKMVDNLLNGRHIQDGVGDDYDD